MARFASLRSAAGLQQNLSFAIDPLKTACLNQDDDAPLENVLTEIPTETFLASDCDEQLLITISFTGPVRLHSLVLQSALPNAPSHVSLFVNMPSLDFDDAENSIPVQELDLDAKAVAEGDRINLEFVKFQNVHSITLFVDANANDDDVTALQYLAFYGSAKKGTDMSQLEKTG